MLDPFTQRETLLRGHILPGDGERVRLQDDLRRRLEALDRLSACASKCGIATDPDQDLVRIPEDEVILLETCDEDWANLGRAIREWRRLVPLVREELFGFPSDATAPLEESSALLTRIGSGVEASAFESKSDHTIYKFYRPHEDTVTKIGSTFVFRGGDEAEITAEAHHGTYRDLLLKLYIIEILDGMPTEIIGSTPEGILIVKQSLGESIPQGADVSKKLPPQLIEIPSRFLRANRDHPRLLFADGTPYLVADLHARNFVKDASGTLRVIDLVAAEWPAKALARVPMIGEWIERVRIDPTIGALPISPDDEL